jgi:PAB-dependent poly(A)-specific ribonuclease subunit 3
MSFGGPARHFWEPSALNDYSPMGSLSNVLAGKTSPVPTIQPGSAPNKGAHAAPAPNRPAFFPLPKGPPQANAIASSGSSTTESLSELTSSSSRDSLPAFHGRSGPTTPQKPASSTRRKKSNKANARWSRGEGSSDDTGAARKPPTSQPAESAQSGARSPQTASNTRQQPTIATNTTSTSQARPMATTFGGPSGDSRRGVVSPRPKGRGMTMPPVYPFAPCLTGLCRSEEHPLSQCHHLRALSVRTQ